MLMNLLEKYPVISIDEARILGEMKGIMVENHHVVAIVCAQKNDPCISHSALHQYIQIPVKHVIIGPNAIMLKKSSLTAVLYTQGQVIQMAMGIYSCTGELIDHITGIDVNTNYEINGIHTKKHYIKAEDIIKIGDVIIVDSNILKEPEDTHWENHMEFLNVQVEEANIKQPLEKSEEEIPEVVYARYNYLLGKQLINEMTVADITYAEGSLISKELITSSIENNCILNLIMSAED